MGLQVSLPQENPEIRRRWSRCKMDIPVRLIAGKPRKAAVVHGRGRELNRGGMEVFAGTDLSIGEQVAIEFTPPYAKQSITFRGVVRNRRGYTYGIEFISENEGK